MHSKTLARTLVTKVDTPWELPQSIGQHDESAAGCPAPGELKGRQLGPDLQGAAQHRHHLLVHRRPAHVQFR